MDMCTQGHHIIAPGTEGVVVREGVRYCPEHVPPESIQVPHPDDETKPYVPTLRQQRHIDFIRWLHDNGRVPGDDRSEPLTDAEIDRLARHVLP